MVLRTVSSHAMHCNMHVPYCIRLHELDATAGTERLPHACHAVVPQLAAALEGVRFAAEQALKRLIADCLDDAAVAAAVNLAGAGMGASAGPPSAAAAVVASVAGALDLRCQDAWPSALSGTGKCLSAGHMSHRT